MKVIIGIPAYNEENNIGPIVAKLKKKYDHILVCDDGSSDMTESIASSLGALVVRHHKNLGYGGAIKTIFNEAKKIDGDLKIESEPGEGVRIILRFSKKLENS